MMIPVTVRFRSGQINQRLALTRRVRKTIGVLPRRIEPPAEKSRKIGTKLFFNQPGSSCLPLSAPDPRLFNDVEN